MYIDGCSTKTMEGVEEMPTGSPKPQTIASEKYQKKAGWMTKGVQDKARVSG